MIRQCERVGCGINTRRRKFCSDRCASIDRQRKYDRKIADGPEIEMTGMSVSVKLEHSGPRAFGVLTTGDVAFIFDDDATRFRHMGIREFPS